ncbi:MAG: ribosomal protein [Pseudomonadota bacterium]|jgi:small subunit ribosomal protein S9
MANVNNETWTTGRRKEAVARVRLKAGTGVIEVNGRTLDAYFGGREVQKMVLKQPLQLVELEGKLDLHINVVGGGLTGQSGAIRHGIARAIAEYAPELRTPLKRAGMLTRDSRAVERKKYGQPGARRRFQFSKR